MLDYEWFIFDMGLCVLYGLQHSLLTTKTAINIFNKILPGYLWNIIYSAISLFFLVLSVMMWKSSGVIIYNLTGLNFYLMLSCMAFFLGMFFYCFKFTTSFWQWIGIHQVWCSIKGKKLEKYYRVRKNGLKKYIRFPHHTFLILIFWCQPVMTLDSLLLAILATVYTYVGTVHQDYRGRRLLGDEWVAYSKGTNLLFPNMKKVVNDFLRKYK